MLYRSFRNGDTPQLVDIWRAQPPQRGLAQPMSLELFEQLVLAKPYFDNHGLILALDGERAVGFAHAGFGPTEDESGLDRRFGVTSLVLERPNHDSLAVGHELLARSEQYLRASGAEVLYAGGIRPLDPFYRGLYGGSELPGVLATDSFSNELYKTSDYSAIDRVVVLERELAAFRAPVDRAQMQIRRNFTVDEKIDPAPRSWWEACSLERFQVIEYTLTERDTVQPAAMARFWMMETYVASWGVHAAGLFDLSVATGGRRRGLATHLLAEAFRRLGAQGISLIEAQTMANNVAAVGMYQKLGFHQVDQGVVYRKQAAG
ncbi:MAG: GNAT family N-acetyltransferase [Planctomycetia bacterium]|nr:GNAT family N-acetyltransferase [Planctomycetia bacterium]